MQRVFADPEAIRLLDSLERRFRINREFFVVCVACSRLLESNRRRSKLLLVRSFLSSSVPEGAEVHLLACQDIYIIGDPTDSDLVVEAAQQVRLLYHHDPVIEADERHGLASDDFVTVLYGERQIQDLIENVREARYHASNDDPTRQASRPALSDYRTKIQKIAGLSAAQLRPHLRRQPVVLASSADAFRLAFYEIYTDIRRLEDLLGRDFPLGEDKALFNFALAQLDTRVAEVLEAAGLPEDLGSLSLNVDLTVAMAPAFQTFLGRWAEQGRVLVECGPSQVFADFAQFERFRAAMRELGVGVVLDRMSLDFLAMVNVETLPFDHLKLSWDRQGAGKEQDAAVVQLSRILEERGRQSVILARCDSEAGLIWGLTNGITSFQGHYIDKLLALGARRICPRAGECPLRTCLPPLRQPTDRAAVQCHYGGLLLDLFGRETPS